jgi:hypothetical protein
MKRSVLTSCSMIAIGKSGARSSGVMGLHVPGCNTGSGATGRSATMLYQVFGISVSGKMNLRCFILVSFLYVFCMVNKTKNPPFRAGLCKHDIANAYLSTAPP